MYFYKPAKLKQSREISCFVKFKTLIKLIFVIILTLISYGIVNYHVCFIKDLLIIDSILLMWIGIPFFLSYFVKNYLECPYEIFLNFSTTTFKDQDLFTDTKNYSKPFQKGKIQINIFQLSDNNNREDFLKIEKMYIRLIMFWYAQKYNRLKLRAYFPMLSLMFGVFYFFIMLFLINELQVVGNIGKMFLMTISLVILYFAMTAHINSFLNSQSYINDILESFNKINFNDLKYTNKLKLFFDKNFLVYIHDAKHNRHFCLNSEKSFNKLILNGKFDIKGRNLIIAVFISLFLILFIEISVNVLVDSTTDEIVSEVFDKNDAKQTKPIEVKIIDNGYKDENSK